MFLVDKMCLTLVKGLSDCRTRSLDIITKVYSLMLSLQSSGDAVDLAQNLKKVTPTVLYIPNGKTQNNAKITSEHLSVLSLSLSYSLSLSLLFSFYGRSKCTCTFTPAARSKSTFSCLICTWRASVGFCEAALLM